MENTAKIYIMGAAAVLVSGVKLEDWKQIEKCAPEKLKIVDENTGEQVFMVSIGESGGSVISQEICWGSHVSNDGNATVTVLLDDSVDDKKDAVLDVMGSALLKLMEFEETVPQILDEIRKKRQEMEDCITIV